MVYVDEIMSCRQTSKWPYGRACHLVADSVEELHYFAGRMHLNPSWFQDKSLPHYDLTAGMRTRAIRLGAHEIGRNKFVEIMHMYRSAGQNEQAFLKRELRLCRRTGSWIGGNLR